MSELAISYWIGLPLKNGGKGEVKPTCAKFHSSVFSDSHMNFMILLSDTLTLTTHNSNGFATSRPSKAEVVPWNSWWTKLTNEKTHWNPYGSRPFNKMVDFQGCFLWLTSAFFCWQLSNSWCSPSPMKEKCTKRHFFQKITQFRHHPTQKKSHPPSSHSIFIFKYQIWPLPLPSSPKNQT